MHIFFQSSFIFKADSQYNCEVVFDLYISIYIYFLAIKFINRIYLTAFDKMTVINAKINGISSVFYNKQVKALIKCMEAKYILFSKLNYVVTSSQLFIFPFLLNNWPTQCKLLFEILEKYAVIINHYRFIKP